MVGAPSFSISLYGEGYRVQGQDDGGVPANAAKNIASTNCGKPPLPRSQKSGEDEKCTLPK